MPFGGFGAIAYFGVHCESARSRGYYLPSESTRCWYDTKFYVGGQEVGFAYTEGKVHYPVSPDTSFETTYFVNGQVVGSSRSVGHEAPKVNGRSYYDTTYYIGGEVVGTAHSEGSLMPSVTSRCFYDTTYTAKGVVVGTSHSEGLVFLHKSNSEFTCSFTIPSKVAENMANRRVEILRAALEDAELVRIEQQRLSEVRAKEETEEIKTEERLSHEKKQRLQEAREKVDLPALRVFYRSKSGFFNAGGRIFGNANSREQVFLALEGRARKRPGGASDLTLIEFRLK